MKKLLLNIAMVLLAWPIYGQIIEECPDLGTIVLAGTCEDACVVCDLDGYTGTNATFASGEAPSGFCAGSLHNTQWVGFVAGSEDITLEIAIYDCEFDYDNDGIFEGLQIGIYQTTDCNNFSSVFNCDDQIFDNTTGVFTNINPLTIGGIYFLVLDGAFGDICSFTINVTAGSTIAPEVEQVAPNIVADPQICQGGILDVTVDPPIFGAGAYYWTLDGEAAGTDRDTGIQFPTELGFYELCVDPYNPCSEGVQNCMMVEVVAAIITPINEVICEGDIYEFNGIEYTEDDIYDIHIPIADGCDEYYELTLDVIPTQETFLEENICINSFFEVGNEVFDETGEYSVLLTSDSTGCDSIVYLDLTVVGTAAVTQLDEVICYGEVYLAGGDTLTESGNYFYELIDVFGCDSMVDLSLEVLPAPEGILDVTICIGETYPFNGTDYSVSGTYATDIPLPNGCDSLAILNLMVLPNDTTNLNVQICSGQSYPVGMENYATTGLFQTILPAANGCDSIVILDLHVLDPILTIDSIRICQGESYMVEGDTYSESGSYDYPYVLPNDCDSIYRLVLDVVPPLTQTVDAIVCVNEIFSIGGEVFDSSGTYTVTRPAPNGCDSLYTLNLTVLDTLASSETIILCAEDTYTIADSTLSVSGLYEFVFPSQDGCDSTVSINLQVAAPIVNNLDESICSGATFSIGNELFDSTGNYTRVLTAANGCDSTVQLMLNVEPAPSSITMMEICTGNSANFNGVNYDSTGIYDVPLQTQEGCDSIAQLVLTVIPNATNTITPSICAGGSYAISDTTLSHAGSYSFVFPSSTGCDSILTLILSVEDTIVQPLAITICEGENYTIGNNSYDETGWYENLLSTPDGCDSIVQLDLSVIAPVSTSLTASICSGENYEVGSESYSSTGIFTTSITSINTGCDSIVTLDLTIVPTTETFLVEAICADETFDVGTETYNTAGSFTTVLRSVSSGCDSIVYLDLTINDLASTQLDEQICDDESFELGSVSYTETGVYEAHLSTSNGCDSTVMLNLYVAPCSLTFTNEITNNKCEGESAGIITFGLIRGTPPYTYNWQANENGLNGGGTIATNNELVSITNLPADDYTINVTDTNGVMETLSVSITAPMALQLELNTAVYDGGFQLSCVNASDGRISANVTGGTPPYSYNWSNGTSGTNLEDLPEGEYELIVEDANNCSIAATAVLLAPDLIMGELEVTPPNCIDDFSGSITVVDITGGTAPYLYALNDGIYSPAPLFLGIAAGTHVLNIQDANGCSWALETVVEAAPELTVDLGEDAELAYGDSIQLSATPSNPLVSYQWLGEAITGCDTCANPWVSPKETTLYQLFITDENNCTAEGTVTVFVSKEYDVFIPTAFSPNGDNFNDRFSIYGGNQLVNISLLRIFNRWGAMVYETEDLLPGEESRGWDGRLKGQPLPEGVYVYLAEIYFLDGTTEVFRGEVMLLR